MSGASVITAPTRLPREHRSELQLDLRALVHKCLPSLCFLKLSSFPGFIVLWCVLEMPTIDLNAVKMSY